MAENMDIKDGVKVEIVSPENLLFSKAVKSVSVPGIEGYFTVMGDHAPLMSVLKPGFVLVEDEKDKVSYYVGGGFADISLGTVTILAEEAKTKEDFDPQQIEAAIKAASELLEKAESLEEKNIAQSLLDGWKNLALETKN